MASTTVPHQKQQLTPSSSSSSPSSSSSATLPELLLPQQPIISRKRSARDALGSDHSTKIVIPKMSLSSSVAVSSTSSSSMAATMTAITIDSDDCDDNTSNQQQQQQQHCGSQRNNDRSSSDSSYAKHTAVAEADNRVEFMVRERRLLKTISLIGETQLWSYVRHTYNRVLFVFNPILIILPIIITSPK